jgi:hypothetical protein
VVEQLSMKSSAFSECDMLAQGESKMEGIKREKESKKMRQTRRKPGKVLKYLIKFYCLRFFFDG